MKKRLFVFTILGFILLLLTACDGKKIQENYYNVGDTVSTDIATFTLDNSQPTIALVRAYGESFGLPKEYDSKADRGNPYVANTGHTLIYAEFTISNKGRSGQISIENDIGSCKGLKSSSSKLVAEWLKVATAYNKVPFKNYKSLETNNSLLFAGEVSSYRYYLDVEKDIEQIKDKYYITFSLPNSKGKTEKFTYVVNVD